MSDKASLQAEWDAATPEQEWDAAVPGAAPPPEPGSGEVARRGLLAGAGLGWQPQLAGAGAWAGSMLGLGPGPAFDREAASKEYTSMRDEEARGNARAEESSPLLYNGLKMAGSLPSTMAAGGSASAAQRVGNMALLSGLNSAGESKADTAEGVLQDAGIGAAIGGAAQYGGDKLFGWLGRKLSSKADDAMLEGIGFTRQQHRNIARKVGSADGYEARIEDIVKTAKEHGITGHSPWDAADAARRQAADAVGGQYSAAAAAHPSAPGLSMNDILRARTAASDGVSSGLGQRALGKVDDEVNVLLGKLNNGELGPVEAHKWALDIKSRLFPSSGAPVGEGVDPQMMMRFRQELVDSMRSRARAMAPDSAPAFQKAIEQYGPLDDLARAARQGMTRDQSGHSALSTLGHNAHLVGGLASFGLGAGLGHSELGAYGGAGMALAGAVGKSPTMMRMGASTLSSRLSGGVGRSVALQFPRLAGLFMGQEKAAEDFKNGLDETGSYTPHTPTQH